MKALVTGGCGFIGSNLVDRLVSEGHQVVVIDNLSADSNDEFYFNKSPLVTYIHENILNADVVDACMQGCDHVFHMAAESRIGPTLEDPAKACHVNFVGTCNVLQSALKHNVKSVVYSSTSACYGLAANLPQKETDKIDNLNPYSVSKYAGEDLCSMFHKLWGLNVVNLRYFNVYGERMPTRGIYAPVIGIFLKQKKSGETLTVVGDGLQRRDFVHVYDVVSANISAAMNKSCYGKSYNVGTGKSFTILEIAKSISDKFTHIPPRIGEARDTQADHSSLTRDSGWEPKLDLFDWLSKQ